MTGKELWAGNNGKRLLLMQLFGYKAGRYGVSLYALGFILCCQNVPLMKWGRQVHIDAGDSAPVKLD